MKLELLYRNYKVDRSPEIIEKELIKDLSKENLENDINRWQFPAKSHADYNQRYNFRLRINGTITLPLKE